MRTSGVRSWLIGGVILAVLAHAVVAPAQEGVRVVRVRVAVITQPDSGSLRVGEAVRMLLGQTRVASGLDIVTMRDVLRIVDEAYRSPDRPITFADMREVARLLRADVLIGLTANTARARAAVVATLGVPVQGTPRMIGTWQTGNVMELAKEIVKAAEADSLFVRVTTHGLGPSVR